MKPETRKRVLDQFFPGEWITTQAVAERASRSEPWAYAYMNDLVKEQVLNKQGDGRQMVYCLARSEKNPPPQSGSPEDAPPLVKEILECISGLHSSEAVYQHLRSIKWDGRDQKYFYAVEKWTTHKLGQRMRVLTWKAVTRAFDRLGYL